MTDMLLCVIFVILCLLLIVNRLCGSFYFDYIWLIFHFEDWYHNVVLRQQFLQDGYQLSHGTLFPRKEGRQDKDRKIGFMALLTVCY